GLFVAVRGTEADGHLFIDKAVQNGAKAIVCEAVPDDREHRFPGTAFVHVSDSRSALAELAAAYYGDPSRRMKLIGVTGTNGKTTVTHLIYHVLTDLDEAAGLMGTSGVRIGEETLDTRLTTPDALDVQRHLSAMLEEGRGTCVMEVSSHALDQERVRAIDFDVAVFTNFTRDHLDYHGSEAAYLAAKKRLFDDLDEGAEALYNLDDPAGTRIVTDTRATRRSFGVDASADIRADIVENRMEGLVLNWAGRTRRFQLVGRFNVYNLLAAAGAVTALGHAEDVVIDVLESAPPVPGRFEQIAFADGTRVIVDYAHTPDALENALQTIVNVKDDDARLWCVFGCGGERDRSKRPLMAAVAERFADRIILTTDNPRREDPDQILADIQEGLSDPARARVIADRRRAIEEVAQAARSGDVVLVAGRGHEAYQIFETEKKPFDDRQVVREAFTSRNILPP
ncbi:MAG: UDP-N-acetylmuramoyl-L-alanyl-D-glutamate--2,6-diaminopimelate ligase, partial [Rhodothermales bacterium]